MSNIRLGTAPTDYCIISPWWTLIWRHSQNNDFLDGYL